MSAQFLVERHCLLVPLLLLSILVASPASVQASGVLIQRAETTVAAARLITLADEPLTLALDAIWFVQQVVNITPDAELEAWTEVYKPEYVSDIYYPVIEPTAQFPALPLDPGTGVFKLGVYISACVGSPDSLAFSYLETLVSTVEVGYAATHQLLAVEWALGAGRILPQSLLDARPVLLATIEAEHAADPFFSDLYAERMMVMMLFGDPDPADVEVWVETMLDAQTADGVWDVYPFEIIYDGVTWSGGVSDLRHVRGLSVLALTVYLDQTPNVPTLHWANVLVLSVVLAGFGLVFWIRDGPPSVRRASRRD